MRLKDLPKALKVGARRLQFDLAGRFVAVDRKLWLFHGPFEGNTKYLFLWLTLHRPDIRAVWLARSAGLAKRLAAHGAAVVRHPSPQALRLVATAGFHFVDDYGKKIPFRSSRSFLVSLWHGVGVKNIGVHRDKNSGPLYIDSIFRPNFLVAASRRHADRFVASFLLPAKNCPILGTPRLDAAFDPELARFAAAIDGVEGAEALPKGGEIILYAPTLRDANRPFLHEALPRPEALDAVLARRNAHLYVKLHPRTLRGRADLAYLRALTERCERIRVWPQALDVYGALAAIDVLITDYSSIFADFLFAKPVGLVTYPFDRARYEGADRSFHVPYELVEAERADDFDALCRIVETGAALSERNREPCARTRRAFWDDNHGIAAPRIAAFFADLPPTERPGLASRAA